MIRRFPSTCHLVVKDDAIPKACPARRIPLKIKDKLKEAIAKLVEDRVIVIVPVDKSCPWINNLIILSQTMYLPPILE